MFRLLDINTSGWLFWEESVETPDLCVIASLYDLLVSWGLLALSVIATHSWLKQVRKGQTFEIILTMCLRFRLYNECISYGVTHTEGGNSWAFLDKEECTPNLSFFSKSPHCFSFFAKVTLQHTVVGCSDIPRLLPQYNPSWKWK